MSSHTNSLFLLFSVLVLNIRGLKCSEILNASETAEKPTLSLSPAASSSPPAAAAAVVLNSPVFKSAVDSLFSLNLLTSFPEDQEVSEYCSELLHVFGQRYVELVRCLVPAARPVKVCQSCFTSYDRVVDVYKNISSQMGPGNESCSESLIRGDRLMLVYVLYSNLEDLWQKAKCQHCITENFPSLTNDTVSFMAALNQTIACFDKYRQGNHTELCKNCTGVYKNLSRLYNDMEKRNILCIDIEDAMNVTRRLWSKSFNCSFPREETVPVIAVSSFMLFLPIIFYLSSYLHSEQKKRKIIHPRRAKSSNSLMNIQDKLS